MNIKQFLGMYVVDNNANVIGKVSDFEFDEEFGNITHLIISQKSGLLSQSELVVSLEDVESIGDYILLNMICPE
ncbi:MAG: PRC-barrel domain-containing protein [Methanobrevibacter sp.]|jgi:sporulation protein YlmC with PRC-barrel domain|nr:PRC-barrel domain-containing protein [Candidatus Methanoflexus mossambicus]